MADVMVSCLVSSFGDEEDEARCIQDGLRAQVMIISQGTNQADMERMVFIYIQISQYLHLTHCVITERAALREEAESAQH